MGDYDLRSASLKQDVYQIQVDGTAPGVANPSPASGLSRSGVGGGFPPRRPATPRRSTPVSPYAYAPTSQGMAQTIEAIPTPRGSVSTVDGSLLEPFRGAGGARRADEVRRALGAAVLAWWTSSELPPDRLLLDGLLVLEAGYALDESQRTLLARTALARNRGVHTALARLGDPERMAALLHEALLNGSCGPEELPGLRQAGLYDGTWTTYLTQDLRADLALTDSLSVERAQRALDALAEPALDSTWSSGVRTLESGQSHGAWLRWTIVAAFLLCLGALWYVQGRAANYGDVVHVPAGTYSITDDKGEPFLAQLSAFVIDRTEVTNAAYRECFEAYACPWPLAIQSESQREYFRDPAFANHPMANVTWDDAKAYCEARGMRLPTTGEWEVAARFAPATQRYYTYPWGDLFQPQFVQAGPAASAAATVGSRSPQGDSPLGLADMAGNVAEWSASSVPDAPGWAFIKGGSWIDDATSQASAAMVRQDKNDARPWLGFRCAATP